MRFHRVVPPFVLSSLALAAVLLTGCGKSNPNIGLTPLPPSGPPVILITQTPEYPGPGQFPKYHRGLVGALWEDGRIVRCADKSLVGKTYVSGVVPETERKAFLDFLKTAEVQDAPKLAHLRLHTATLQITMQTTRGKEKWICALPDDSAIWVQVEGKLLGLPVPEAKSADDEAVRTAGQNEE